MTEPAQNYSNQVRAHAPFAYFLIPALTIHMGWTISRLWMQPGRDRAEQVLLAAALIVLMLIARTYALKVQDRIIRLEERLRYQRLFPADLAARAGEMPLRFIIALRFAADEELAGLVNQVIAGKFEKPKDAKKAIRNWRADTLRV
jgi:hypothetical protein